MYIHVALYKWKPAVSPQEVQQAFAEITALAPQVTGIIEISCAENVSQYSEGYTHVILVRAETQEAIDAYRAHPAHRSAAHKIELMEQHGIGVDFVTPRPAK